MGTFFNNANCDIYIGSGAGKKLLDDIKAAKRNVKIISPYLSPFLIKELINLHKKGIQVQLITTDTIEDYYGDYNKNIHKLIIQDIELDKAAREQRNNWKNNYQTLIYILLTVVVTTIFGWLQYGFNASKYGIIIIAVLLIYIRIYNKKIKNKRIYYYTYRQLFPFKVMLSKYNQYKSSATFIHSKIYCIDDEIVYMGSLNFTAAGTTSNHETRIRTTHPEAVKLILQEFSNLFTDTQLPQRNIHEWGKQLYREPIN